MVVKFKDIVFSHLQLTHSQGVKLCPLFCPLFMKNPKIETTKKPHNKGIYEYSKIAINKL